MTQAVATIDFDSLAGALLEWLQHGLIFGTAVALVTWAFLALLGRRIRPAFHACLWLVVLIKFVVPIGPSFSYSMASTLRAVGGLWPSTSPAMQAAPVGASDAIESVIVLGVSELPAAAAVAIEPARHWPWASSIVATYVLGISIALGIRARSYRIFARRCRAMPRADADVREAVRDVCARLNVRRVPDVYISDEAPAPFIFGVLRPTLVLSRRQLVRPDELEAVILHEVAHLRRGDLWVRQLQWVAGTLLFFWPVVAWVNRRIDLAREHACDEWALRYGRLSAGDYARCLLNALQPMRGWRAFRPAAMAANRKTVERRIDMILASHCAKSGRLFGFGMLGLVAGWGAFVLSGAAVADCPPEEGGSGDGEQEDVMIFVAGDEEDELGDGEFTFEVHALEVDPVVIDGGMMDVQVQIEGDPTAGDAHVIINGDQKIALPKIALPFGGMGGAKLAEFLSTHPTADANGDGELNKTEYDAYHVALAMSNPAAVLAKFPKADRNKDGKLDASEAALGLVSGGAFMRTRTSVPATWTTAAPAGGVVASREMRVAMLAHGEKGGAGHAMAMGAPFNREVAQWLQENVNIVPPTGVVASYIEAVEQAPFAELLAHSPEADTNGDGKLSADEHEAFMAAQQAKVHARILKKHPEADANNDGELTEDEESIAFFHKDAATRVVAPEGVKVEGEGNGEVRVRVRKIEVNGSDEPKDN